MDRNDVRRAWDDVSEAYATSRDPDGPDTTLIDDLLDSLPADPVILDVGCGDGARTLSNLPDGSVGLDISSRGLELASETVPQAQLVQGDLGTLPFREGRFDAITAYYAVFHVPRNHHPAVYREFARVLRPGGRLLMTLPTGRFETVRQGWMGGRMFFSAPGRSQTLAQLRDAGFGDLETVTTDDPLGSNAAFVFGTLEGKR